MTDRSRQVSKSVFTYDLSPSESPSQGVVSAVSAVTNADPVATDGSAAALEPLYTVVDPDALDSVFRTTGPGSDRANARVSFRYHGHEVTVHGEDRITVEPVDGAIRRGSD